MTDPVKQYLYLVVDRENKFVISICPSPSIANALSNGFLNSSVMVIYWPFLTLSKSNLLTHGTDYRINFKVTRLTKNIPLRGSEVNVAEPSKKTTSNLFYDLVEIDFSELHNDWHIKRKLANKRLYLMTYLERAIDRYMIKYKEFSYDELFYSAIKDELKNETLKDYAEILGMTEKESISHLKNKLESMTIYVIRMRAFWEKYVNYINIIQLNDDSHLVLRSIEIGLMGGERKIEF